MTINYFLAPIPRWQFTKADALYNVRGKLGTYRSVAKDEKKYTYQDPAGLIPYANPIRLDGVGSVGPIYWADDEKYYIELTDENDQPIWSVDGFPFTDSSGGGTVSVEVDYDNQLSNGQFRFHNFSTLSAVAANTAMSIAEGWMYVRDNISGIELLKFEQFLPGQPPSYIEGNPKYYFHYECNSAGSGEAKKRIYHPIQDVRSYAGRSVTLSLVARSATLSNLSVSVLQNFGTGGSPSTDVETLIDTKPLTANWAKYYYKATLPSISGKNLGTNKDDFMAFNIDLPLNALSEIDITNVQVTFSEKELEYQYKEPQRDLAESLARGLLPRASYWEGTNSVPIPTSDDLKYLTLTRTAATENWGPNSFALMANPPVGSSMHWWTDTPPDGWIFLQGQPLYTAMFRRLFNVLGRMYTSPSGAFNADAEISTNEVTVTMFANGAVSHVADVNTGFTFAVTQNGDATHQEKFKITCNAGATLNGGEYFTFQTPDLQNRAAVYIVDGNYNKATVVPAHSCTYIHVNSADDASTIASKSYAAFHPLAFQVPDPMGYFARVCSGGTGRDPDSASRTARPDGTAGNAVGTTQQDQFKDHVHGVTIPADYKHKDGEGGGGVWDGTQGSVTGGANGGNETRGKNIYVNEIMKY